MEAKEYLGRFENDIVIAGVAKGIVVPKTSRVPVQNGKLNNTKFGQFLGSNFEYDSKLVIDYYGLLKKSTGFKVRWKALENEVDVKRLESPVVYFASIKIEHIVELDESLAVDFVGFKKYLVHLRKF